MNYGVIFVNCHVSFILYMAQYSFEMTRKYDNLVKVVFLFEVFCFNTSDNDMNLPYLVNVFCSGRLRLVKLEPYCNEEGTR